jgi:hypothetical protein
MSYTVTLPCGCDVRVSCHPISGVAHNRVLARRDLQCTIRKHEVGARVWLWELLPDARRVDHEASA